MIKILWLTFLSISLSTSAEHPFKTESPTELFLSSDSTVSDRVSYSSSIEGKWKLILDHPGQSPEEMEFDIAQLKHCGGILAIYHKDISHPLKMASYLSWDREDLLFVIFDLGESSYRLDLARSKKEKNFVGEFRKYNGTTLSERGKAFMKFLGPQNSIEIHDLLLSVNWISRMKDEKYWFLDPNQKNLDAHGFVAKNDPRLSGFCYGFQRSGGTSQLGRLTYGDLNEHWRARIPITSHEGKVVGETVEVKSVRAKEPVWIRFIGESVSFDFIDE